MSLATYGGAVTPALPDAIDRSTALKALAAVGAVMLVVAAVGGYFLSTFETPRVESVENEFGDISEDRSAIRTQVSVVNPNDRDVPGEATVAYTVSMNSVEVAEGRKSGVRIPPGRTNLSFRTAMDNRRIPAWWVTHVNRDERTVLRTSPRVSLSLLPVSQSLPAQTSTIETDLLGPLANESERSVTVANESVLTVSRQQADWGEATGERTPLRFSTRIRNDHSRPITLDAIAYRVRMNDVAVGTGVDEEGVEIPPGEARTVTVDAAIDTPRMQRWWVSHLRRDQATNLSVDVAAVVGNGSDAERLPLDVLDKRAAFETNFLGEGNTSVEVFATEQAGITFTEPTVDRGESRWGAVTDEHTEIVTEARVENPNRDSELRDLLAAETSYTTSINDVEVASNTTRVDPLPLGSSTLTTSARMDTDDVPVWWARHLNDGERSTTRTRTDGDADVGITTYPLNLSDDEGTFETNMLAGLNDDSTQTISAGGRPALTIHSTEAEWGQATPERAPLVVHADMENEQPTETTLRDITYTVELNDVTLANRTNDDVFIFGPGERRTIETTLLLNNSKMAEWWPTHVRNGERSTLTIEAYATVESGGETERVELDFLEEDRTVETDVLGATDGE